MTQLGKFSLRLAIYGAVLLYLAGDLLLFRGPMRRKMDSLNPNGSEALAAAKDGGVVARVFNHQITDSQVERAMRERLWLEGKTLESLAPASRKIHRMAALSDLIDHEILRVKAKANAAALILSAEEIDARFQAFASLFESQDAMEKAMKSQGLGSVADLRDRLAAHIQQERYVESKIGAVTQVSDEEARAWYEENQDALTTPERVEVRHVFIGSLDHPQEEGKAKLDIALRDLTEKRKDFSTLSRELSEDEASKGKGGALGWMTRTRLPADFSAPVFDMPVNQPALVRTKLGWHLVEVTAKKPAEPRVFEDAKDEIVAALETIKRAQMASKYRDDLRIFEKEKIQIFEDRFVD